MTVHAYVAIQCGALTLRRRLAVRLRRRGPLPLAVPVRPAAERSARRGGDRGQTTAEYALVIIGAAAVALLLLAWATETGRITALLDRVAGTVANMVR